MTTQLEEDIRAALHRTAASMSVPDVSPGDRLVRVAQPAPRARWGRVVLAAATVVVLGGTALAVQHRRGGSPSGVTPGAGGTARHFETPTVVMDATSIEVIAGDQRWMPPTDVTVGGDPGLPNESTTLELTWHDGDDEQRIFIYFQSNGVDWWADEIRTYDDGDWYSPAATGEFFRSPLGTPFTGDLDLPNLRIEGLQIEAFVRPDLCASPTTSLAVLADYPVVNSNTGGGFGATFQVLDTATCASLPVADYTWQFVAADPTIVAIDAEQLADYPPMKFRIGLQLLAEGTTTITATARSRSGDLVGTADMTVDVGPPLGDGVTTDTTIPSGVVVEPTAPATVAVGTVPTVVGEVTDTTAPITTATSG